MKKTILKEEVDQILQQSFWNQSGLSLKEDTAPVAEAPKAEEEVKDEAPSEEAHVCPLCESKLEADISDDQLKEHVEMIASIITEMEDITDEEIEDASESEDDEVEESVDDSDELEEASCTTGPKMKDAKKQAGAMKKLMKNKG